MRIGGVGTRPEPAAHVAAALSGAASALGQRPAITVVGAQGRQEQGFVSLAGWVAKGAHLLRDEFDLGPGDRLGVASPPCWPLAAVVLSAWWLGVIVVPAATPGLRLQVRHVADTGRDAGLRADDVLWIGDAMDGTGIAPAPGDECWTDAVIPYPDRAPTPSSDPDARAVSLAPGGGPGGLGLAGSATQRELLAAAAADPGGVLGILRHGDTDLLARSDGIGLLAALTLRPLVTGSSSVVVSADDEARAHIAESERVMRWLA